MKNDEADYDEDYKYGVEREIEFVELWNKRYTKKLIRTAEKNKSDITSETGKLIELKSDKHTTNNFFIELISNCSKNSLGGPRQAQGHGSDFYIIWFPNLPCRPFYLFKIDELVEWLNKNENRYRRIRKRNKYYETEGILVDRSILRDLYIKKKTT